MKFYRATIEILIRAEGEGEACDGMSGLLTETGIHDNNLIADWAYSHGPVEVDVPDDQQGREEYFADGDLRKGLPSDEMENLRDRNGKPPLTKEEMARFRELFPLDYLSRVALAAWVNVRPDQLPKEMQAHTCPATMEAWGRVAKAIRTALKGEQ